MVRRFKARLAALESLPQAYLGIENESSVPLAELTGVVLALQLATNDPAFQGRNKGRRQAKRVKQMIDKCSESMAQANPSPL
jgi:hypothetical protein